MMRRCAIIAVLLLLVSCDSRHRCTTPIGDAACSIDITLPSYSALAHPGGYVYLVGGHSGLFVIRISLSEFKAFERACPIDHATPVVVDEEWGGDVLTCPKCGSRFSTYTDGVALDGSATPCPLNQYFTSFDGRVLSIW